MLVSISINSNYKQIISLEIVLISEHDDDEKLCVGAHAHRSSPASFVLMSSKGKNDKPQEGHYKTEHGNEHHPALRVLRLYASWGHQDPYQATKYLQHTHQGKCVVQTQIIAHYFIICQDFNIQPPGTLLERKKGFFT